MYPLDLITSVRAVLTKTVTNPDKTISSFPCDIEGKPIPPGAEPLPIFRDRFTAKTFVRIAETIPTAPSHADEAAAINERNPVHFANNDVRGWFVEAPDFNEREGK
jgi:hypothetical protein